MLFKRKRSEKTPGLRDVPVKKSRRRIDTKPELPRTPFRPRVELDQIDDDRIELDEDQEDDK
ncbi:MAG TPA: hypothetical protein VEO18_05970 [Thermoplasmata archaeon]|nr:hypothetical protein [Thermoplasmata archaeon]